MYNNGVLMHIETKLDTYKKKYDEWKSTFNNIYSSTPYELSLTENAENLISYWQSTVDFYLLTSYQLGFDPLEIFKFLSTVLYIIISVVLHILILSIVLPISAIFFSPKESIQDVAKDFIEKGLISIQSIGFALFDLVFQSIAFSLCIVVRPFISLYYAIDYMSSHYCHERPVNNQLHFA